PDAWGRDVDGHVADALAALTGSRPGGRGAPGWLARAKEMVDDAPEGALVSELARAAGVHPVYLARQFRRHFGVGVSGYVRRRRLCRAASFAGRRSSLTAAAHQAGFADLAHLCREFKREARLTPGEFARMVGNVQAASTRARNFHA